MSKCRERQVHMQAAAAAGEAGPGGIVTYLNWFWIPWLTLSNGIGSKGVGPGAM